jgi:hypothetical protein
MVPTRADQPGAAIKKINNIDKIVKAKLGLSNDATSGVKKIRVERVSDGKQGTINESDFDESKYKRL